MINPILTRISIIFQPPSQASAYVTLALGPLKSFNEDDSTELDKEQLMGILKEAVALMTSKYFLFSPFFS